MLRHILFASIALLTTPLHATSVDFTPFKGKFRGSWLLNDLSGTISVIIKVPSNGSNMSLTISGLTSTGDDIQPIKTKLKFAQNRKLASDAFLMGFTGGAATLPAKYKNNQTSFKFSQTSRPGATIGNGLLPVSGIMKYSLKFSKSYKILKIVGVGTVYADNKINPVIINIKAKRKGQ